jgi:hypothetical protein
MSEMRWIAYSLVFVGISIVSGAQTIALAIGNGFGSSDTLILLFLGGLFFLVVALIVEAVQAIRCRGRSKTRQDGSQAPRNE